jgi:hypothetical protein
VSLSDYQLGELLAVGWNPEMAVRFPNADHYGCRQEMRQLADRWAPHVPARCVGYHCNRCGAATNSYGHHSCPDRAKT